jgi:hypothetical protein
MKRMKRKAVRRGSEWQNWVEGQTVGQMVRR